MDVIVHDNGGEWHRDLGKLLGMKSRLLSAQKQKEFVSVQA